MSNENSELSKYIDSIDPLKITPLEAINDIFKIKELNDKK